MSFSSIILTLFTILSLFTQAKATDTLSPGQSLRDGSFLVSAGKIFEFGFFSSPNYSTNRYVGIWYYDSPNAVLWVANRDSPVPDKFGSLSISTEGNLILIDSTNKTLWSSNASSAMSNETTVKLLDSGNLQINDSGRVVWQSLDHPADTYLPGMKVGLDITTNVNYLLKSWKSSADPAAGNYSVGMDPAQSTQVFIWEGTEPRWRLGRWSGQEFIGFEDKGPFYIDGFQISNYKEEGKMYFYYPTADVSHRFVLRWDGILEHLVWKHDTKAWSRVWAEPITDCQFYNKCGNGGVCTDNNTPVCSCLQGYVPKSGNEWNNGNWTSGCIRRTPLQCEKNASSNGGKQAETDGFLKLERVKVPDLSVWQQGVDITGCEQNCRANCSCKAYSYVKGIGCLVWGGDLRDIQALSTSGDDLYLRLAGSELDNRKKTKNVAIIVIVAVMIFSVGCSYLVWKYRKRVKKFIELRWRHSHGRDREGLTDHFGGAFEIRDDGQDGKHNEPPFVGFDTIVAATDNFSLSNLLGKGGFGPVYKGTLPDGKEIAVKRLSRGSGQGLNEFKNEVILISKLQHRNLVRLLGCCIQGEEKILIYEHMPNRSLDAFLFDAKKKGLLDWKSRYNIIQGIVRGLLYLHRDSRLRVIHRDLKVSNILLDEKMKPKISDFGMARIFGHDDKETNTKRIVGT